LPSRINSASFKKRCRRPPRYSSACLETSATGSAGKLTATLELYSGFDATQVEVNGKAVPLQTDTTTPIAQGLNNSAVWKLGVAQFLSAKLQGKTGIRRMEPLFARPDSGGVCAWHSQQSGLVAEMWNTLNADPELRQRHQFWMFNYASGNPITYTAGILRDDLMNEIKTLDPDGKDPALQHMVIIGHSQGGLLAKLTAATPAINSGGSFPRRTWTRWTWMRQRAGCCAATFSSSRCPASRG